MKLSELIRQLQAVEKQRGGDIKVYRIEDYGIESESIPISKVEFIPEYNDCVTSAFTGTTYSTIKEYVAIE